MTRGKSNGRRSFVLKDESEGGVVTVRFYGKEKQQHRRLAAHCQRQGISINQFCKDAILGTLNVVDPKWKPPVNDPGTTSKDNGA